jgi:hypothetical protein
MRRLADPPPSVNPDTYVPLSRRRRLAGVNPHPDPEGAPVRPGVVCKRTLSVSRGFDARSRTIEGHEEGVTLGVDLVPTVRG